MKKIIFVGGGTLGHIYPFLPLVNKMKDQYDLYFIGTTNGLEKQLIETVDGFKNRYYLDMQGFRRSLSLYNFVTLKKYFRTKKKTKKILKDLEPDLVIGMGGYISGVVINESIKHKIKTIIHEQNSVMGLANKLVEKKVDRVLLSFPVINKIKNNNVTIIGNPRLSEIYEKYQYCQEKRKFIVIVGGSRGSKQMNEVALFAKDKLLLLGYKVVLITGKKYYDENIEKVNKYKAMNFQILGFTNELITLIQKASVVVSRSGATTIVELMALSKVCLFIPSPNVTSNHQEKNADILVNNECALKLLEKDLTVDNLIQAINRLEDDNIRIKYKNNIRKLANYHAADDFIKVIEKLL